MPVNGEGGTVLHLFSHWVGKAPARTAVTDDERSLTYRQLDDRSAALAARLRAGGVGRGDLVGICLPRTVDLAVAALAVLKAGAAYLPLDPQLPAERLRDMVADAGTATVLTDASVGAGELFPAGPELVGIDDADAPDAPDAPSTGPGDDLPAPVTPGDLAYVIYTSGSTGRPKGVQIEHGSLAHLLHGALAAAGAGAADDRPGNTAWTMFHSFSFDFSVWEMWGCLCSGGTLVVVPYLVSRSPHDVARLLVEHRITDLSCTPSAFRQLGPVLEEIRPQLSLRRIVFGGEALAIGDVAPWLSPAADGATDAVRLINMYGITEITVHGTHRRLRPDDLAHPARSTIGRPLDGYLLYVADPETLAPLPPGEDGELLVGGPGLARGYLNRPELTAERFVTVPVDGVERRVYRSGDLVRQLPDGEYEYLGRIDRQVKLRGFRIELGEVEAVLSAHPEVRTAVVDLWTSPEDPDDRRLVAYVVPDREGADPDPRLLTAHAAVHLPDYMIPAHFVALDRIPLTPNGKTDRDRLPPPTRPVSDAEPAPADLTPEQRALLDVLRDVLGGTDYRLDDNYFRMGGNSLLAMRVIGLLGAHGYTVDLKRLFQSRTLADLAAHLEPVAAATAEYVPFSLLGATDRDLLPAGVEDAYPLSMLQRGMLFEIVRDDGTSLPYHICTGVRLDGVAELTEDSVAAAVRELTAAHPALRTTLHLDAYAEPLQLVHREPRVDVAFRDRTGAAEADVRDEVRAHTEAMARRPIDHGRAPLVAFTFFKVTPSTGFVTFAHPHAILDGWSVARVVQDLHTLLRGDPVRPARNLMPGFVAAERAADEGAGNATAFWTAMLDGVEGVTVPPRLHAGPGNLSEYRFPLGDALRTRLDRVAGELGVPLKTLFLAAHMRVASAWSTTEHLVSGLVCNGRPEAADADRGTGLFLNTVPIALPALPKTWQDLAGDLFRLETDVQQYRRTPLTTVRQLQRDAAGTRLPLDVSFNYTDFSSLRNDDVHEAGGTEAPLMVSCSPGGLCFQTSDRYFGEAEIDRLAAAYVACLESLATDPLDSPHTVELTRPQPGPERPLGAPGFLDAFLRRATERPERIAVREADGRTATYGELEARSREAARALRRAGVGEDQPVGLAFERSVEVVVALLGILRAGGVYVPLDPDQPPSRLDIVVADAGIDTILAGGQAATALDLAGLPVTPFAALTCDREGTPGELDAAWGESAYIIYTSGSTGLPKGVRIGHASLGELLAGMADVLGCTADDVVAARSNLTFDMSVIEVLLPLYQGATVALVSEAERSPSEFGRFIDEHHITLAQATPATWRELSEEGWLPAHRGLKLLTAGEPLPPALVPHFADHAEIHNLYGPTEATVYVTAARPRPGEPITIGRALPDCTLLVQDRYGALLPPGVPGELVIGRPGLAQEYLNRPDLTAERFVTVSVGGTERRVYRSGDVVRQLPDGEFEYLGRIDRQVKLRGFRVEPGEIEAVLTAHPDVRAAVVDLWSAPEDPADQRLVAYVVPDHEGADVDARALTAHASEHLPGYMVPSRFLGLDRIPLTPNGKTDRRELTRAYEASRAEAEAAVAHEPPRGGVEQLLADVGRHAFRLPVLGRDDNFLAAGAHSLSLMRYVSRLRKEGIYVTLSQVFAHPTVAGLAASVEAASVEADATAEADHA